MRTIAWNHRGLRNGAVVCGLLNVQKEEDPDILFLSETKLDKQRIEGLRWKLGLTNMISKDYEGRSGGLPIFWRKEINLHVCGISRLYIDAEVTEEDGFLWRLTCFYGEPSTKKKTLSCEMIKMSKREMNWTNSKFLTKIKPYT